MNKIQAIFIVMLFLGMGSNSFSKTKTDVLPENGKSTAAQVCMNLSFESEKEKCMNIVRMAEYFDDSAVRFCSVKTFTSKIIDCMSFIANKYFDAGAVRVCQAYSTFDSKQDECLRVIVGKRYEAYEISYCTGLNFESKILQCMKDSGQAWSPAPPDQCNKEYVRRKIRQAMGDIDMGNPQRAKLILNQLYYEL